MKTKVTQKQIAAAKPASRPYEIRDMVVPGFLCRVQPTGRKTYIVEYKRGKRFTIGNAQVLTPSQAREKARAILVQVAEGIDPAAEKRQARAATLRGFIESEFRPWARANRKRGDENCNRILRVFTSLADKPLTSITDNKVERIRTKRLNDGISPSTVNRDVTCLRGALSFAVRAKYLHEHPLADMKDAETDAAGKVRFLSEDEASRLKAALKARDDGMRDARIRANQWRQQRGYHPMPDIPANGFGDHLTPLVLLSLNTGIRRGEALGLCWNDVDFGLRQIMVRGATSKKNRSRHIPLNDEAIKALERWHAQCEGTGLVFTGRDGGQVDNVRKAWTGVLHEAGTATQGRCGSEAGAMITNEQFLDLTDNEYRKHVIECLIELRDEPIQATPIRKHLADPLWEWIEMEYQRFGRHNTATEAAQALASLADDIAWDLKDECTIHPETIKRLSKLWRDWIEVVGSSFVRMRYQETMARKKANQDNARRPREIAQHDAREIVIRKGRNKMKTMQPRVIVGQIYQELVDPPSKQSIRKWLQEEGILPKKKKKTT